MPWKQDSNPARFSSFQSQEVIWCPSIARLPNSPQQGLPVGGASGAEGVGELRGGNAAAGLSHNSF